MGGATTSVFVQPPAPVTEVPETGMVSVKGHVNGADWRSLLITAGLFAASAFITSVSTNLNLLHLNSNEVLLVTLVLGMLGKFVQKIIDGPQV